MKKIGMAMASLYALFCAGLILILPMNKFEWMLDEPSARTEGLTFCGLPIDDGIDLRSGYLFLLIPFLAIGITQSIRQKRIHYTLWIFFMLLAIWGWRFFIHYPIC